MVLHSQEVILRDQKYESIINESFCPAIFRKDEPTECLNDHGWGSVLNMQPEGQANGFQWLLELGHSA